MFAIKKILKLAIMAHLLSFQSDCQVFAVPLALKRYHWVSESSVQSVLCLLVNENFTLVRPTITDSWHYFWASFIGKIGVKDDNIFIYSDGTGTKHEIVLKVLNKPFLGERSPNLLLIDPYFLFIGLCFSGAFLRSVNSGTLPVRVVYEVVNWMSDQRFLEKMRHLAESEGIAEGFENVSERIGFLSLSNSVSFYNHEKFLIKTIANAFLQFSQIVYRALVEDGDTSPESMVAKINRLVGFFLTLSAVYNKSMRLKSLAGRLENPYTIRMVNVLFDFYPEKEIARDQILGWLGITSAHGLANYSYVQEQLSVEVGSGGQGESFATDEVEDFV